MLLRHFLLLDLQVASTTSFFKDSMEGINMGIHIWCFWWNPLILNFVIFTELLKGMGNKLWSIVYSNHRFFQLNILLPFK
jgi:hypothetical protein